MTNSINVRLGIIAVILIWASYVILPNFIPAGKSGWWLGKDRLKYGLDIQGGLHLVMGVDTDGVLKEQTAREADSIKKRFVEEKITINKLEIVGEKGLSISIEAATSADIDSIKKYMEKNYFTYQMTESTGQKLVYTISEGHITSTRESAVNQAIETLRNRIDEFGVSEPNITKQGTDRILIQLPLQDMSDVKIV